MDEFKSVRSKSEDCDNRRREVGANAEECLVGLGGGLIERGFIAATF